MKYIDADLLRKEIERLYYNEAEKDESILAADAYKNALDAVEKFLDSIPEQEHPIYELNQILLDWVREAKTDKEQEARFEAHKRFFELYDEYMVQEPEQPWDIPSAGGGMSTIPPSYKLDVKPEQPVGWEDENAADKKAVKEIVKTVHKEVTRQVKEMVKEQPASEGLEEEADRMFFSLGWYEGDHHQPMLDCVSLEQFRGIARHFAEWGAEHLKK